jgi:hypothetical protein
VAALREPCACAPSWTISTSSGSICSSRHARATTSADYAVKQPPAATAAATPAKTSNPVKVTQSVLTPDAQTRLDTLTLLVAKSSSALLTVSGANIHAVAGPASVTPTGIALPPGGGVITLTLDNLTPRQSVVLTSVDANNKPLGDPITLTVELAAAAR